MEEDFTQKDLDIAIQRLVDKGIVDYTVNEDGEFLMFLTPYGRTLGNIFFGPPGGPHEG